MLWVRHLLAIAALPFLVAVIIPWRIARRFGVEAWLGGGASWLALFAGVALLALGFGLFAASLRRFISEGHGTLAPWDPPRAFVVHGPYRYVRNPMISGVVLMLFGEAAALRSAPHALWAATFLALNALYLPLVEEPGLRRRFGEAYAEYCKHVPRILPRLHPWTPPRPKNDA